jgi:DNA-binding response OmpR family regulator
MDNTILIIDDSWTTLVLLEHYLKDHGYSISVADSVEIAMKYLENNSPSLILLDLQMPKISGFDFLVKYKKDEILSKIPVLIISANDELGTVDKVKEMGAVDFVPKPFELHDLLSKIQSHSK